MTRTTISQADLARNPQAAVDKAQHGSVAVVEGSGREQVILLEPLDFRLLRALALCALEPRERDEETKDPTVGILQSYLGDEISLGKAAELLDLSRFELQERFHHLGIPLRLGSVTLEEARAEVAAALKAG
jgi:predicted HTH domain antitoxin